MKGNFSGHPCPGGYYKELQIKQLLFAAFLTCFRCFLGIVFKTPAAFLSAFFTGIRRFLFIVSEITGTASMLSHKTSSHELLLHGGNNFFNAMPVLQT